MKWHHLVNRLPLDKCIIIKVPT